MNSKKSPPPPFSRHRVESMQLKRLNELIVNVQDRPFYSGYGLQEVYPLESLDDLCSLPLLTKEQLLGDAAGRPARVFDLPRPHYNRLHQTSGTQGFPMTVLDTPEDWAWWLNCWDYVLDAADAQSSDVAMMAFSFGPFIGFWTANDALVRRGTTVVPGGGMTSLQRIQAIFDHHCTILCCTPTYALHLGAVADKHDIDLTKTAIRRIIVAGEPGGSTPSVRNRLETLWGAKVIDHTGASEVGAWGFGNSAGTGIHVIEDEFIAELLRFDVDHPEGIEVEDGEQAELVLTSLGRLGGPVIRYRTGDIVRGYRNHDQECGFLFLEGGVLGRVDDMMVIRGVNVFPSSIESMVREIAPLAEFRMIVSRVDEMDQLAIELEADQVHATKLSSLIRDRLAMRATVEAVAAGSLPRFEAKAKRLVDRRKL